MSFSRDVKDELLKKDFTSPEKPINISADEARLEMYRYALQCKFLENGSVTDPNKDYHLEFICRSREEARETAEKLEAFSLHPKLTERGKHQLVYLKDASEIADVLNIIGAHNALMDFENVRILKEVSENVNRRVNFETANINRTVHASVRQMEDILLISERLGLDSLDEGLREIAEARMKNQDASLEELAAGLHPPIGKSGANHRMRKLSRIADRLREEAGNAQQ